MTEKAKRKSKGNPRRRILVTLITVIALIVAVGIAAMNLLRPTGQEIVYIASNENGFDNIWIVDLNNPDKPRQLTDFDTPSTAYVTNLQLTEDNRTVLFSTGEFIPEQFRRLNLDTANLETIFSCDDNVLNCASVTASADGNWLAYFDKVQFDDNGKTVSAYIYHIENAEETVLYTISGAGEDVPFPHLGWVGDTNQIAYQPDIVNDPFTFEFYDVYQEQVTEPLVINELQPIFNRDGSIHSASSGYSGDPITFYPVESSTGEPVQALDGLELGILISGLMDWHPNNEDALIMNGTSWNEQFHYHELSLYNALTGDKELLMSNDDGNVYSDAVFNTDGAQFIYYMRSMTANVFSPFSIYDMETAEQTVLAFSGSEPLWVKSKE